MLSWPTHPLFIVAFCPPSIVPCCLAGGNSKGRTLNAAPLLSLLHFPLIIAVVLLRPPLSMFTNFYCLRAAHPPSPCVEKFRPKYWELYWPFTWSHLFCFNLDRLVIKLSWKVAHGVLYTADRLIGFSYAIDANFFCSTTLDTPFHLFSSCPLTQSALSWLQSLMFSYSSSCLSLVCRHVLFGFYSQ